MHVARVLLLEGYVEVGAPEDVVELPRFMSSAFVYIPQSGGKGMSGLKQLSSCGCTLVQPLLPLELACGFGP